MERSDMDMTYEEAKAIGLVVPSDNLVTEGRDQEGGSNPPGMAEALSAPGNVLVNNGAKIQIGRVDTTRQTLR